MITETTVAHSHTTGLQVRASDGWFVLGWGRPDGSQLDLADDSHFCVAGDAEDMLGLAAAIEQRGEFTASHCAVHARGSKVRIWSPKGSSPLTVVTLKAAAELAGAIRANIVAVPS